MQPEPLPCCVTGAAGLAAAPLAGLRSQGACGLVTHRGITYQGMGKLTLCGLHFNKENLIPFLK